MFYSIRHVNLFRYNSPVRESVMELRMQPRSEGPQTLRSFQIGLDRSSAPRGTVIFRAHNAGTDDIHEFLVIRTDRAPNALPTEDNGSYEENGPGTQLIDEIEEVAPGATQELSLDLTEGNYVLICNMVHVEDDGSVEVHYALGMHTAFRVE